MMQILLPLLLQPLLGRLLGGGSRAAPPTGGAFDLSSLLSPPKDRPARAEDALLGLLLPLLTGLLGGAFQPQPVQPPAPGGPPPSPSAAAADSSGMLSLILLLVLLPMLQQGERRRRDDSPEPSESGRAGDPPSRPPLPPQEPPQARTEPLGVPPWAAKSPWLTGGGKEKGGDKWWLKGGEAGGWPHGGPATNHDPAYWAWLEAECQRGPVELTLVRWGEDWDFLRHGNFPDPQLRDSEWGWLLSRVTSGMADRPRDDKDWWAHLDAKWVWDFWYHYAFRVRALMERYPTLRVTLVTGEDGDHTEREFRVGQLRHFAPPNASSSVASRVR